MIAQLPIDEEARLKALRGYNVLDTFADAAYDDIVRVAAFVCDVPIAAITFLDAERLWFKSVRGRTVHEKSRDLAFCSHTILQPGLTLVNDATSDPRFADNPLVTGDAHIRFYAAAPLIDGGGHALGCLCVIDTHSRNLSSEQQAALTTLSHSVINLLELSQRIADHDQLLSEWHQSEEAQRLLSAAVGSAKDGIIVVDARQPDLPIIYANSAFLSLSGYQEEEVLKRNCRFLQGKDTDRVAVQHVRECLTSGSECSVTLLNYRKDSSAFWNELTVAPILNAAGELTHFVGIQHDVTALKGAEANARQKEARLVEAQRIGKIGDWVLDISLDHFTWSEEMFHLLEFDPALGEPTVREVLSRYHPEDRIERDRLYAGLLASGEPIDLDIRLILPSGTPRSCHLVGKPELGSDGHVTRVTGTFIDITERVEREQRLTSANVVLELQKVQLKAANAELEALVTTDPLTGLLNYLAFHAKLTEAQKRAQCGEALSAVILLDLDDFRFFNEAYGHSIGDAVLRQVAARLKVVFNKDEAVAHFGGDEFTILLPNISAKITRHEIEAGVRESLNGLSYQSPFDVTAIPICLSVGSALILDGSITGNEALRLAEERLRRAKAGGQTETEADRVRAFAGHSMDGFTMLDALVTAVDNKDRYTRKHSEDVMEYSLMIAENMGMDEATREIVAIAALLHDVGKIGIPDSILRKPGKLTEEEFAAIKQHPMMGALMVGAVPRLEKTLDAVRHHHERWDGDGYPFGFVGTETPLIARLMAVADAFSAMTTDRPYRKGMERQKALGILEEGAGSQWDPACVDAFLIAQA